MKLSDEAQEFIDRGIRRSRIYDDFRIWRRYLQFRPIVDSEHWLGFAETLGSDVLLGPSWWPFGYCEQSTESLHALAMALMNGATLGKPKDRPPIARWDDQQLFDLILGWAKEGLAIRIPLEFGGALPREELSGSDRAEESGAAAYLWLERLGLPEYGRALGISSWLQPRLTA